MYSHAVIAVALDHEALVARKLDLARRLLDANGRITLVTVLEDVPGFVAEFVDMEGGNPLTSKVERRLGDMVAGDGDVRTVVVRGKPGVQVPRYARENGGDLIIVGSHHPTATDYFLGSTASRIARRADCSVLIVR